MEAKKQNIRHLNLDEIKVFLKANEVQAFRGKQIYEWLWKKSARSFEEMSNLSKDLRQLLSDNFTLNAVTIHSTQTSSDRTIKFAFKLFDGNIIEGVLIPTETRMTACVSSQVGCSLSCKFCATGSLGFTRNLFYDEIYDQVAIIGQQAIEKYQIPLTNIVFMGMGEPLLNYDNLLQSIEIITNPEGLGMSPRRITVSTVGLAKFIKRLGDDDLKFNLALSLHAANDIKRQSIIPVSEHNSLGTLIDALKYYHAKTQNRITIEYLLIKGFNDTLNDAKELAVFCRNFPVKVNLIEYNSVEKTGYLKSIKETTTAFAEYLESKNMVVNIRYSRGKDIDAACGQLANKIKNK
jgi:23S rRNA (adenine2503-C2)-methyltransferase